MTKTPVLTREEFEKLYAEGKGVHPKFWGRQKANY